MKFKFTDEQGNNYYVEISARDDRNINASKKATQIVLTEIVNLMGCAAYHYHITGDTIMQKYARKNVDNIIDVVL